MIREWGRSTLGPIYAGADLRWGRSTLGPIYARADLRLGDKTTTRREFLKTTVTAGTAMGVLGPPTLASAQAPIRHSTASEPDARKRSAS